MQNIVTNYEFIFSERVEHNQNHQLHNAFIQYNLHGYEFGYKHEFITCIMTCQTNQSTMLTLIFKQKTHCNRCLVEKFKIYYYLLNLPFVLNLYYAHICPLFHISIRLLKTRISIRREGNHSKLTNTPGYIK